MTRASLGISPITSLPYVCSLLWGLSLGTYTMVFNVLLITAQKLVLKKDFTTKDIAAQTILSLVFSAFIDLSIFLFGRFMPQAYPGKMLYLLFGCMVLALGVSMVVIANFAILPGEGAAKVIARLLKREFGTGKIIFDSSCVLFSSIFSLIGFGKIIGIREGTIIAALLIGSFSKIIMRFIRPWLERFLNPDTDRNKVSAPTSQAVEEGSETAKKTKFEMEASL